MESLYLPRYDAFVRCHAVGSTGPVIIWLPGIGSPPVGNFLATATQEILPQIQSILIDLLGAGSSDAGADIAAMVYIRRNQCEGS